jgi:hypothetical protein
MKTRLVVSSFFILHSSFTHAATTITDTNHYAYGANVGWMEGRGDVANGAVIGEYVCSGYFYAANVGWINLGSGSPPGGIYYTNTTADNWGVNQDGQGNLRGYAYGANIGWINFEDTGAPKVDLSTGKFSGYAFSANCGWISLSNAQTVVQTASIAPGMDSDGDGIADGWELTFTNTLTAFTATSDTDHDGMMDKQEYLADTNPLDPNDKLRITSIHRGSTLYGPTYVEMYWTAKPTRFYSLERREAFALASPWEHYVTGFDGLPGWNNIGFYDSNDQRFYRVRALRPLMP